MTTEDNAAPAPQEFLDGRVTLYGGDNRDVLRSLPDCSVDSIVTDPPYALVSIQKRFGGANAKPTKDGDVYSRASSGFMGRTWDTGEVAFSETFWAECLRVLKPGGHVVAFSGTRTYHRMAVAIEDAGFEIRDQLAWAYGTGFPKNHDVAKGIDKHLGAERRRKSVERRANPSNAIHASGFGSPEWAPQVDEPATPQAAAWNGWGTALKPSWEPICLARKPLCGTVAANVLEHGTGALNIDATRIDAGDELKSGNYQRTVDNSTVNISGAKEFYYDGSKGRWPANIVHDGSDEVLAAFPRSDIGGGPKEANPTPGSVWGIGAERSSVPGGAIYGDSGSAARFFYTAKADKLDRIGSKHPTVKPVDLMQWLVRLVTPKGGLVLDPFAGSGSTGEAAWREGMRCILIEREEEYQADIAERLRLANAGPGTRKLRAIKQAISAGPLFGAAEEETGGGRQIYGKFADQQPGYRKRGGQPCRH